MNHDVNLRYVSGSTGEEFILQTKYIIKVKDANFHNYAWLPQIFEKLYGANVKAMRKEPVLYEAMVWARGSHDERRIFFDRFHFAADLDVARGMIGRLYWGRMYIECYIISSSTYPAEGNYATANELGIYCPHPSWIYEKTYARPSRTVEAVAELMGVPEDEVVLSSGAYPVPMAALPSNFRCMILDNSEPPYARIVSNSETIISGRYATGQDFIINSMTQKVTARGDYEDAYYFDYFDSTYNIFQRIEPFTEDDLQVLDASGNPAANVILTVFFERSEPVWI